MAGRGRGRPPKKKGEERATQKKSLNHSISSISECSSNSDSEIETLIHKSTQHQEIQTQSKSLLTNWIEAASISKSSKAKNTKASTQTKAAKAGDSVEQPKSATLAGFFVLKNLKSGDENHIPDSPKPNQSSASSSSCKEKVMSAIGSGFWTLVDMASGRYLWRYFASGSTKSSA